MTNEHPPDFTTVPAGMTPFPPIEALFVADPLELPGTGRLAH